MKIVKIKDRKYYRKVYLMVDFDTEKIKAYFKRKYPKAEDIYPGKKDAHFFMVINENEGIEDYYICLKRFEWRIIDIGLLSHEVLHLVFKAMSKTGLRYSKDSEEAYTYYFDGIFQEILAALRPKRKNVKGEK